MLLPGLSWHDWLYLRRYQTQTLCLDTQHLCTGGRGLLGGGLLSYLAPATGVYTVVDRQHTPPLVAQIEVAEPRTIARWIYLAPDEALDETLSLDGLLQRITQALVSHGVQHLLAEVPEEAPCRAAFTQAGFQLIATLRLWRWEASPTPPQDGQGVWAIPTPSEQWEARRLLSARLPNLARPVWPFPNQGQHYWVYRRRGIVEGAAWVKRGPQGTWVQVALAENLPKASTALHRLSAEIGYSANLPLFFAVPENDTLLSHLLQKSNAVPGARVHVLHRPLALRVHHPQPEAALPFALLRTPHLPHPLHCDPSPVPVENRGFAQFCPIRAVDWLPNTKSPRTS